jgi:hypothetical protein
MCHQNPILSLSEHCAGAQTVLEYSAQTCYDGAWAMSSQNLPEQNKGSGPEDTGGMAKVIRPRDV